ncbi:MAG TPA: hypothetical protein VKB02_05040 [Pyrinomonadaceae bacterium]|nr:hypothetical protein [Pyrinomonadaceae bacterium]
MYTQDEINQGQRRINYELVEVDKTIIETLEMIAEFLKKVKEIPPLATHLQHADFTKLDAAIAKAHKTNSKVADIKPPGCEAPPPYPN